MVMKNVDQIMNEQKAIINQFREGMDENKPELAVEAMTKFGNELCDSIVVEMKKYSNETDVAVLASRGIRQLTGEETKYYNSVIGALGSSNPQQALTELDVVMPVTTIDAVFDALVEAHPLLGIINFQNTSGLIEFVVNTHQRQLATWGLLTDEISKEITSGFKKFNLAMNKLSAYLPIANSMLDLGAVWLDKYIRTILYEAMACGLEEAIINGTGKDMPIGMNRQVQDDVVITAGVYPLKDTVAITSLDPVAYGALLTTLSKDAKDYARTVDSVVMIVNPTDYLNVIMPATTIRSTDGSYVNNVFPFPTTVIQSVELDVGKAIIGLPNRYFMAIGTGTGKEGKLEKSDEVRFLEDERLYRIKMYGHGQALDNNAFVYADISGLVPVVQQVSVVGPVTTIPEV